MDYIEPFVLGIIGGWIIGFMMGHMIGNREGKIESKESILYRQGKITREPAREK